MLGKAIRLAAGVLAMLAVLALGVGTAPRASAQAPYMYPFMGNPYMGSTYVSNPYVTSPYVSNPYVTSSYVGSPYMSTSYVGNSYSSNSYAGNPYPITISGAYPSSTAYTSSSYSTPSYSSSSYSSPSYSSSYSSPSYSSSNAASSNYSAAASGAPYGIVTTQVNGTANSSLGTILTDSRGMTLYMLSSDSAGVSTCYDTCPSIWPPALQSDDGVAMSGSFSATFSTTTRSDGSVQLTYNGKPLYFFSHDMGPGDTNGEGVTDAFGHWTVATP